jgi:hypothetical protein
LECYPEQRRAGIGAFRQLGGEVPYLASPALHGAGHDGPHIPQASQGAHSVGDGARRGHVPYRAALPDPFRHPGGATQPDEARVVPLPRRRNQDIDQFRLGVAKAVTAQRRRAGDQAALARVQQRGHLQLERRRRPGPGQVDAGQEFVPRPAGPEAVRERMAGQAGR